MDKNKVIISVISTGQRYQPSDAGVCGGYTAYVTERKANEEKKQTTMYSVEAQALRQTRIRCLG